ncbi:MAG: 6-phosphogluconolactonase [Kofleriaceae bacterium]|nr:6-phosphogluconolactonase [Candidatus Methylomirabilis lanthanidiphila]
MGEDQAVLAREAAERLVVAAQQAMTRVGRFTIALAGGSTPKPLYALLTTEPYRTRVPWPQTHVFWGDERTVPPDHTDSNFAMAMATLLGHVPIPPEQIYRMPAERADLDAAACEYEAEIARRFAVQPTGKPPAFDLILLGLGTDGHTASLFPHSQALRETRRWVVANAVPQWATVRLTLTAPILNRGAMILFLVAGADKAPVLREVLEGPADPERLPAQLIRPREGHLLWLVDRAAAGQLSKTP